jgi:hypothetical protein
MGWGRWSSSAYLLYTRLKPEIENLRQNYKCAGIATGKAQSLKDKMIEEQLRIAEEALLDETNRLRAGFSSGPHLTQVPTSPSIQTWEASKGSLASWPNTQMNLLPRTGSTPSSS